MAALRLFCLAVLAALSTCLTSKFVEAQPSGCEKFGTKVCLEPRSAKPEDELKVRVPPSPDRVPLDPRKLYRVDVKCQTTGKLPARRGGIFGRTDVVASHFVAITDERLTTTQLPTKARALIPVYSVSSDSANRTRFINFETCNRSFVLPGGEDLYVSATVNITKTTKPSIVTNLFFTGLKFVNPVWPLIAGSEAAALLKPRIEGLASAQGPVNELFSHFKSGDTWTVSHRIYQGERNIRSTYSRVVITTEDIPSVMQTMDPDFITSFEASLTGYSEKLAAEKTATTKTAACRRFGNQLLAQTFPAYDVAYALSYITRTAGLDKSASAACIGNEYGLLSTKNFTCAPPANELRCLWNRFPEPLKAQDFERPYPVQKHNLAFFKGLRNAMTDYAGGHPAPSDAHRENLAKYIEREVELVDLDRFLDGDDGKVSSEKLMQQLVSSEFTKFGCPSKDSQAAGVLFGFPPTPSSDGTYKSKDTVALRAWIGPSKKIFKIEAFFGPALVETEASKHLMYCGRGLQLAKETKAP